MKPNDAGIDNLKITGSAGGMRAVWGYVNQKALESPKSALVRPTFSRDLRGIYLESLGETSYLGDCQYQSRGDPCHLSECNPNASKELPPSNSISRAANLHLRQIAAAIQNV